MRPSGVQFRRDSHKAPVVGNLACRGCIRGRTDRACGDLHGDQHRKFGPWFTAAVLASVNASRVNDVIDLAQVSGTIAFEQYVGDRQERDDQLAQCKLLAISGNDAVGVFSIAASTTVSISGLTIARGAAGTEGGMHIAGILPFSKIQLY